MEILARLARDVIGKKQRDPTVLLATEALLLCGMRQFPDHSLMSILYGSFVAEVLKDFNRGTAHVERARGCSSAPSPNGQQAAALC